MAQEAIEAIKILSRDITGVRIRFVYINSLTYQGIGTVGNKLSQEKFDELFTTDKPIVANFHGYPETLKNILGNYAANSRLHVHGFNEEGSTTTPFEMLRRNMASRYDLAIDVATMLPDLVVKYTESLEKSHTYALEYGEDMIE